MNSNAIVFQGVTQLAGWSESHTGGVKLVLWLEDHEQLDAFRALTVRKGGTAGHRLAVVMVEVGDDELPVVQAPPEREVQPGGALSRLAGLWCNAEQFQDWLHDRYPDAWWQASDSWDSPEDQTDAEVAAIVVRSLCQVKSRAELDHDQAAAARFNELIRDPFRLVLAE